MVPETNCWSQTLQFSVPEISIFKSRYLDTYIVGSRDVNFFVPETPILNSRDLVLGSRDLNVWFERRHLPLPQTSIVDSRDLNVWLQRPQCLVPETSTFLSGNVNF